MHRFHRILLYADHAADVTPALRCAVRLSQRNAATVAVAGCLERTPWLLARLTPATWDLAQVIGHHQQSRLEAIAEQLRGESVSAAAKLLVGEPAVEITREVLRAGHDLLVKTASGADSHRERGILSATTIRLMRVCPCPVWVVGPQEDGRLHRILAAIDPRTDEPMQDNLNRKVLELATSLAERESADLYVANVWRPLAPAVIVPRMSDEELREYVASFRRQARQRVADLLDASKQPIPPDAVHLLRGEPEEALPELAAKCKIDLVVMGTAGRSGLLAAIVGNTVERVLRRLRCGVLAVKSDTFVSPIAGAGCEETQPNS